MAGFSVAVTGTEDLVRRLLELGTDAPRAATRALNRTLGTVQTAVLRSLASDTGLAQKDIRPSLRQRRATFSSQIAELSITGRRVPLLAFSARQTRAGVSYRLPGGRGAAPGAFIATMASGHRGVFVRRQKGERRVGRLPILEIYGPSLPKVAEKFQGAIEVDAGAALARNLQHEIDFMIAQRTPAGDE